MANVLKLQPKSERPMIIAFVSLTFILWALTLKWLVFGEFFENPSPIAFLFGCVTAFLARRFYRIGQAYAILDPSGDGQAETEAGLMFKKNIFVTKGLQDVQEVHVYHQRITSSEYYHPCLQFKDGFELWLPQGEHIAKQAVKWFEEHFDKKLEIITHRNAETKEIRQIEKPDRCIIQQP